MLAVVANALKDTRREQILDALYVVMARQGLAGTSITDIADAAGMARGALHYFFRSKDDIVVALMERMGAAYLRRLDRWLDAQCDVEALVAFHFAGDENALTQQLAVWLDFWGQATTHKDIQRTVFAVQEGARARCLRVLPHVDGVDARHAAAMLLAIIEGALLQWRIAVLQPMPLSRATLSSTTTRACISITNELSRGSA
jgi:AcrR family transcriptional regulator